ncbi:MAG TPA: TetR/AcrR family transcriptional regulator [Inquilinus sp.]|nr:TetR/AcrR family transcriptional regulator [Inquilinus sp.]
MVQPLGRPREFDPDAALDAAMALFWHQGYEATSLDALTKAMDLSRSSFYGCFGSKRDTLVAAIRRYADQRIAALEALIESEPDAERALRAALAAIAGGGRDGCFLINCAVEMSPHDPEVESLGRWHLERLAALLAGLLARRLGVAEAGAVEARARALLSLAVGATVLRKAGCTAAEIENMLAAADPLMR